MDRSRLTGWVVTLAFCSLVAGLLSGVYVYKDLNDSGRQTFEAMLEGTAARPYVYRVVMPTAIKAVTAIVEPARPIAEKIVARVNASGLNVTPWERHLALEYLVCVALTFCCYLGFMLVMRGLVGAFYPHAATYAPVFAGLLLIPFMRYTATIYDPMQLLLFPLATLLVYRKQFVLFGIVFVLACANKETAVLLVWLLFARLSDEWLIWQESEWRMVWRARWRDKLALVRVELARWLEVRREPNFWQVVSACAVFGFTWLAIKLGLEHTFRDNPGGMVEQHFWDHNAVLFTQYTVSAVYTCIVLGSVAYMVAMGWRGSSTFLKVGLVGVFGVLFFASMRWGKVDEIRDYYEALPLAFIIGMRALLARPVAIAAREPVEA